ncbi:MAG: GNAT family N-acetyltransferase [Flammeovirgaceae bacterium]
MNIHPTKLNNFYLKEATEQDIPLLLAFIQELADYEKLSDEAKATPESLKKWMFGSIPYAFGLIGYEQDKPIAFAIYFHNFSTFMGKPGIYLEDVFVKPEFRGKGYGKTILSFLAKKAVENDFGRVEWSVLDWNKPSIEFYKSIGAYPMDEWTVFRLTGENMRKLAADY